MTEENPRFTKDTDGDRPEPATYPAQAPAVRGVLRKPEARSRLVLRDKDED